MRRCRVYLPISLALLVAASGAAADDTEIFRQKFEQAHQRYAAIPNEAWRTIPWKIELLAAQREAAQRQMPIFIWAMDGNPLGCT